MIVCGFVLAGLVIAASRPCAAGTTVCVTDCGATPDDEGNDAEGFRQAAAYCREHPGTTLTVPAGLYRFRDEKAVEVMRNAMTGQYGNNPQSTLMTREFPHVHGLDFTGAKDVTVKAEGATIRFDGWYQPVVLDRTEGVTIRGLTIDHERAPYSVGRIVEVERKHFDAEFDARYPLNANMPGFCVDFYDADAGRRHGVAHYDARLEMVEPDVLRIHASCPKAYLGDYCIVRHSAHGAAAVMVRYARDLRLDRVTIHSHPGMGIVGHRCENLTFQGVRIVPREGELQSTNTDATHFTSCSGTVVFDGCEFEGQGDDSTNIHNYYHTIKDRIDESTCRMFVDRSAALHALDHDYPEAGDTLELVDARTLAPVRRYTVVSREHNFESSETVATLDDVLLEDCRGYRFVNVTRFPSVRIVNCHIRSHLARGILIKTRDVLIEGCTIENTTGTGIHVGAEGDWHEGAPTADLTIRNNRIVHCGLGHGTQNDACAIAINVKAQDTTVPGLHKRVLIEDNEIVGLNAKRGIFASSVEGLTIRNNRFDGCDEPIHVEYSTSVQVCNNHGAVPNIGPGVKIRGAE
ncbi:MAG: right-handed parallel beta-helix repeat-containing protein [bacterium]|nr:right-handed parallel beta-helix repeat-containing protein [bacterium]